MEGRGGHHPRDLSHAGVDMEPLEIAIPASAFIFMILAVSLAHRAVVLCFEEIPKYTKGHMKHLFFMRMMDQQTVHVVIKLCLALCAAAYAVFGFAVTNHYFG